MMKIPKKAAKPLIEEITTSSVQYKNEIQRDIVLNVRSINASELSFKHIFMINSESLSAKYNARRQKMLNKIEEVAFVRVSTLERAKEIAGTGVPVSSELSRDPPTALGNPAMGVYCSKFLDYSSSEKLPAPNEECVVLMCKVLKGKCKVVAESESMIDPTFDYDSHTSKSAATSAGMVSSIRDYQSFFLANQIYAFEYTDVETERYPSNVLPFAILHFTREVVDFSSVSTSNFTPIKSIANMSMDPSTRPLKPLVIWSGNLTSSCTQPANADDANESVAQQFEERACLVSFYSRVNPLKTGQSLKIAGTVAMDDLRQYFVENLFSTPPSISGVSQIVHDADQNSSVFYAYFQLVHQTQLREINQSVDHVPASPFSEFFRNPLLMYKAAIAQVNESFLYIFKSGDHASRIGLTNEEYSPSVLHCIFVSGEKIYNIPRTLKAVSNAYTDNYPATVGLQPKQRLQETRAYAMKEPISDVALTTSRLCNFALAINQTEHNQLSLESYYPSEVISNKFDLDYYSNEPSAIPAESVQNTEITLKKVADLQASQERNLQNRQELERQREIEQMQAQLRTITQAHSQNVERQLANQQATSTINTFSLPKEGALKRSFKKKNADGDQTNKVKRPTNPPIRQSFLGNRNSADKKQPDEWSQRRAEEVRRVNQAMPLYDTGGSKATEPERPSSRSDSRQSSPSPPPPPVIPIPNPMYNKKGGGLLDMPLPPGVSRPSYNAQSQAGVKPELEGASDDMDISNSPEDNNNFDRAAKYMKNSNGRATARGNSRDYPAYLDDRDNDLSPEAPPVIVDDSPIKREPDTLGNTKRQRGSESEDDHPTLDSFSSTGPRDSYRNEPGTSREKSDYVKKEFADNSSPRRSSDISLSGKASNLPDAPYARPERPHFKVEDNKSDRRKAFVMDDKSVPKESDFRARTVGQLTEYAEDHDEYQSSSVDKQPFNNSTNANTNKTAVLTNQLGQKVDINSSTAVYKPPPSWRPDDPAEMCKNLTVSFFKGKLAKYGKPHRNLNEPRFKGIRFTKDYKPSHDCVRRLERMIWDSEDRAEARRLEEIETRERLERDMGIGSSETTEVSTENEMRLLQKRLGRELRNDEWDEKEARFLRDMLELNLGRVPYGRGGGGGPRGGGDR